MSSTLMYLAYPDQTPDYEIYKHFEGGSRPIKYHFGRKWWGHDGTLGGNTRLISEDDTEDIEFIKSLKEQGIETAAEILELIEKYSFISLRLIG